MRREPGSPRRDWAGAGSWVGGLGEDQMFCGAYKSPREKLAVPPRHQDIAASITLDKTRASRNSEAPRREERPAN